VNDDEFQIRRSSLWRADVSVEKDDLEPIVIVRVSVIVVVSVVVIVVVVVVEDSF
jgi:hypothetical protein